MDEPQSPLYANGQRLTDKQIRQIITPYEFGVADHVVGTELARPMRRGIAILIDLLLISMLTELPSILLAGVSAVFFWRAGKKNANRRFVWLRKIFRFFAAILLFGIVLASIEALRPPQFGPGSARDNPETAEVIDTVVLTVTYGTKAENLAADINNQSCQPLDCWRALGSQMITDFANAEIDREVALEFTENLFGEDRPGLTGAERVELQKQMLVLFEETFPQQVPLPADQTTVPETSKSSVIPLNDNGDPSLLAWFRGIAEDLGIGFGWAALYFTAFSYWMRGQTPGKFLTRIKVIKLDGSTMSLWESFERYGGYGAGFATGLLGFLQIYWEPNRQAIQDKISETLVIRLGQARLEITEQAPVSLNDENQADTGYNAPMKPE